ncbi:riboflavin synthase [Brevibacillus fluminis]|uniref:riboflavin synthase n=1 Tax=Brevibacillus fluminis TaxID=511487 RepID=UPI003F8B1CE5
MFTGIIEEVGSIERVAGGSRASTLTIRAQTVLADVRLGDSIAVNGVCLTVTSFQETRFTVDVMPETLKHTNLGALGTGSPVNLERALAVGSRLGGHLVSGHVDGTGRIVSRSQNANAVLFRVEASDDLLRYMIPRGSVTIDGISLTITEVNDQDFCVSIIPHTLEMTCLRQKQAGDEVNLECDLIGKYVERLLGVRAEKPGQGKSTGLTAEFLREHGF